MDKHLIELATAFKQADDHYMRLGMMNTPTDPEQMVSHDLAVRRAMRAMMAAKDAYHAALDTHTLVAAE